MYNIVSIIADFSIIIGAVIGVGTLIGTFQQIKDNRINNQKAQSAQINLRTFKTVQYKTEINVEDNPILSCNILLELVNNGQTPARNIKIASLREFDYNEMEAQKNNGNITRMSIVNKSFNESINVPYLTSGESIKFPFIDAEKYFTYMKDKSGKNFDFEISWENFDKSFNKEIISIDAHMLKDIVVYPDNESASRIHQMSTNLQNINLNIKNIGKKYE